MAFNPFDSFRRNSKAILAILTIFIMFLFVLSTGGGGRDAFDWFARQIGGTEDKDPILGEIDGSNYRQRQLGLLRQHRAAANEWMRIAVGRAHFAMIEQVKADLKNNAIKNREMATALQNSLRNYELIQQLGGQLGAEFVLQQVGMQRDNLLTAMAKLDEKSNPNDVRAARRFVRVLDFMLSRVSSQSPDLFFGELANKNLEDALIFAMFVELADKWKVRYTDDDIKVLISNETDNLLKPEELNEIDRSVRDHFRMSSDAIFAAIRDEYRVRATLAIARGRLGPPYAQGAYDLYQFYRDQSGQFAFEVLDNSVERYLPEIKGEPSPAELDSLFINNRNTEYDPAKPTPGFREPRKIRLQYVGFDSTMPVYRKAQIGQQGASVILGALSDPMTGALAATTPLVAEQIFIRDRIAVNLQRRPLLEQLRHGSPPLPGPFLLEYLRDLNSFLPSRFHSTVPNPQEINASHPAAIALLIGQLAIGTDPLHSVSSAASASQNLANALEARNRVRLGIQSAAAALGGQPFFPLTSLAPTAVNAPNIPIRKLGDIDPADLNYPLEKARLEYDDRDRLVQEDLRFWRTRLDEIRKKVRPKEETEDPAAEPKKRPKIDPKVITAANDEARQFVEERIKLRRSVTDAIGSFAPIAGAAWEKVHPNIVTGASEFPRDRYTIDRDPGIAALTGIVRGEQKFLRYQEFFNSLPANDNGASSLYQPSPFPPATAGPGEFSFSDTSFLVWRIQDDPPKSYANYAGASPEVREAVKRYWRIQKARELAKRDAEALAEKVRTLAAKELQAANNLPAFKGGLRELSLTSGAEMLEPPFDPHFGPRQSSAIQLAQLNRDPRGGGFYMRPAIRHEKIHYPLPQAVRRDDPKGMATLLLDARNQPLGETLVIADAPQMHYYVCVLVEKKYPSVFTFSEEIFKRPGDQMVNLATMEGFREFDKDMINRVKAEMKFKATDELRKLMEKKDDGSGD